MSDDPAASLRDTSPGVPEMDLSKTLPTGAAFHATWRIPNLATAQAVDPTLESGVHSVERSQAETAVRVADATNSTMPNTPASTPAPSPDVAFGTTRKGYASAPAAPEPQRITARERAKRNLLTHTLQMPLVVTPLPPTAADSSSRPSPRATVQGGTGAPEGWTSMHRVGSSSAPSEGNHGSRPPHSNGANRANDPKFSRTRADFREAPSHQESGRPSPFRDPPSFSRPPSATQDASARWASAVRAGDYERNTLPNGVPNIPELSAREWLFIGLLVCASAATLYSLLIDDMTPAAEEEFEAATTVEHVVQPATPQSTTGGQKTSANAAATAAATNITEIVSEPSTAEIVVGGAVIGNTPAHVVRGPQDADYLLRKQGFEPQLVRVTANSPNQIVITLHPK